VTGRNTARRRSWCSAGLLSLLSLILLLPEGGGAFGFVSLGRFPSLLWLLAAAVLLNGRLRRTTT